MVRSVTLLTTIVILSLGRPHSSNKDARPEALEGTESPYGHAQIAETVSLKHRKERKGGETERQDREWKDE